MTADALCPWWKRWWHARLRSADITTVWIALMERAETMTKARQAWELHVSLPGQEHWRCPCSVEPLAVFRTVMFHVDAEGDDA